MSTPVREWMRRRCKAALALGAGLALLLPVPAFALTWLNNWNINTIQTGGTPTPNVTSTDFTSGGSLTIDMGNFHTSSPFSSQVTATREFSVTNPTEALNLADSFETLQKNTQLKVNVAVVSLDGGPSYKLDQTNVKTGFRQSSDISYSNSNSQTLTAGNYVLLVSVKYNKNRFLGRSYYNDVSPFSFTFTGI